MTYGTLSDDLARLEQQLQRLPLPVPPAGLRSRSLADVRRVRARERTVLLAAAAAVVLAMGELWASRSPSAGGAGLHPSQPERAQLDVQALERLGYGPAVARRAALVLHSAGVPRIAPPLGSGATSLASMGGL